MPVPHTSVFFSPVCSTSNSAMSVTPALARPSEKIKREHQATAMAIEYRLRFSGATLAAG